VYPQRPKDGLNVMMDSVETPAGPLGNRVFIASGDQQIEHFPLNWRQIYQGYELLGRFRTVLWLR
jgi:hypothetical protein